MMGFVMSEKIRAFIAFDIDDELVLRRLLEVQGMLANTGADLKLVKPQNIHVTLRFLGNVPFNMVDLIYEEMKGVTFASFNVDIKGLGAFPSLRRTRVVWAGIRKGAEELSNIFNQLEPRVRGLGFKPDSKGFTPHLTIARVRTARRKTELVRCIQDLKDYEFGTLKAGRIKLKKSVLTSRGPIYTTIREVEAVEG